MADEVVVQPNFFTRLAAWYNEVIAEMRKVTWPDRAQLKDTTIKIIIFVLFLGLVIWLIDVFLQFFLVRFIPSLFTGPGGT